MAITPFWIFLKIQMIAISFFFSFLHHLYFFQTQIFCLLCFVYLFVWLSWNASWLSACKSHLWEKQYVWVCCVYGESVHSQVERWHSQLLESKHFFSLVFQFLKEKKAHILFLRNRCLATKRSPLISYFCLLLYVAGSLNSVSSIELEPTLATGQLCSPRLPSARRCLQWCLINHQSCSCSPSSRNWL